MSKARFQFCTVGLLLVGVLSTALAHAQTFQVLYAFHGGKDGAAPQADLIRDANGTLYGTTSFGGKYSEGTVFQLDKKGQEKVLYAFPGFVYGAYPYGKLVRDGAGSLYGTTLSGGGPFADKYGTAFQLKSNGAIRNLIVFSGLNGISPGAGLIADSAGGFYGTTSLGGPTAGGTVFKYTKFGHQKAVYGFGALPDGALPYSPLLLDDAGDLFGTTLSGGAAGLGSVFEVDKSGKESILYSFLGGTAGEHPNAGLIRDQRGNLYGTTVGSTGAYPPFYYGTIFKLDPAGAETVLHSFTGGADGGFPYGGLVQDGAGNLYGTTYGGGSFSHGTVFMLDGLGNFTILHQFTGGKDGSSPYAGLLLHGGRLYGTAGGGGASNAGTIFRINLR